MSDQQKSKIKALEEKVRLLEIENKDWTDRAEDVFLFASTSETIHDLNNTIDIYETVLEKISVMKRLPYCAIGKINKYNIDILVEYASFSNGENLATIKANTQFIESLREKKGLSNIYKNNSDSFNITFKEGIFYPNSYLIFEINNLIQKDYVFIALGISSDDHLTNVKPTIEHVIRLTNSKLDNLYLMDQLANQNKILEERVAERTVDLKESEEKYRQLIEQSNDAIFLLFNNKFEIINPRFTQIFGYTAEEVNSPGFNFRSVISQKSLPTIEQQISRFKKGERLEDIYEIVALKKNKEEIECEVSNTYVSYKSGIATQGVIRDITEKKKTIRELIKAKEDAEKADKLKSEFLAQVSHEIRTPINTILSFASLIKEKVKKSNDEEVSDSIMFMSNAGRRIIRTIDLLINMSEIQSGSLDYNPKKMDIHNELINNLFLEYKQLALEKDIVLEVEILTNNTTISIDEYSVNQIFHNILDNAVKYTQKGKILITLKRDEYEKLVVSVSDTGIGIDEKFIPNLFKPFTQEEQGYTRKFEGNGLGLALVKKYCMLNKASINVQSKKGEGTTFSVVFNN